MEQANSGTREGLRGVERLPGICIAAVIRTPYCIDRFTGVCVAQSGRVRNFTHQAPMTGVASLSLQRDFL